jgi:hypothetical protein
MSTRSRKSKVESPKSKPKISRFSFRYFRDQLTQWWQVKWWHKIILVVLAVVMVFVSGMYTVAQWYIWSNRHAPVRIGATFIPNYARYLDLDPKETLDAIINDLGVQHLRLVSYWKDIEREPGTFDFSELDWQFDMAEKANVPISLAIGLRQPRWPECHMPQWAENYQIAKWQPLLETYITKVVERYRDRAILESYQLENEFFLTAFGICPDFSRERLVSEYHLVKRLDPERKLIISRSNNAIGLPLGEPQPDEFAVSVYKRVWDKTLTKRYFEYPLPAWFYASLAGGGQILTGKDMIVHELQSEAWMPDGYEIKTAPLEELDKSMNPDRLQHRIQYGLGTGMKVVDLWGVEWWYQMKTKRGAPALWHTAKDEIKKSKEL